MPYLDRRFRSVKGSEAKPTKLAPTTSPTPPDLIDVYDDLPVTPEAPLTDKPTVQRRPVVRKMKKLMGGESLNMGSYTVDPNDIALSIAGVRRTTNGHPS